MTIKPKLILILLSVLGLGVILFGYGQFLRFEHNAYGEASVVPGTYDWSLQVGNKTRTYRAHIPQSFTASMPLVIVLHGMSSNGKQTETLTSFSQLAEQKNFIVVYPNSQDNVWKVVEPGLSEEEIPFISTLIDELKNKLSIDTTRVYVTGISNGAQFAQLLGAMLSQKIAAIAPVAGTISKANQQALQPSRPMPVMYFHGTEDNIILYNGVLPAQISAEDMVKWWVEKNQDQPEPQVKQMPDIADDGTTVIRYTYQRLTGEPRVVFYKINGGGHTWPGGPDLPALGNTTHDINATELIWEFFGKYTINDVFTEPFVLKGQVALEGRTGVKDANPTFLQVRIKKAGEDKAIFRDDYVATTQDEQKNDNVYFFEINLTDKLEPGNYDISVKEWHYLDVFKNTNFVQGENRIDFGEMKAGDINNNDQIDIDPAFLSGEDLEIFFTFYDKEVGSISLPPYPLIEQPVAWHADLNNDGLVDVNDEILFWGNNGGEVGPGAVKLFVTEPIGAGTVGYPVWIEGETRNVQWITEPQGASLNTVKLQYTLDQGNYADLTGAVPNAGKYTWQIAANLIGSNVKIKVTLLDDSFFYAPSTDTYAQLAVLPRRTTTTYPTASNVLVVFNDVVSSNPNFSSKTEGFEIAQYYQSKRPGSYLLGISIPDSARVGTYGEEISRDNYEQYIRNPIKNWLDANNSKDIRYVVLTKGVPLKIKRAPGSPIYNESSVDSELSLIYSDYNKIYDAKTAETLKNPYYYYQFDNDNLFKDDGFKYLFQPNYFYNYYVYNPHAELKVNYLVTRLDGYTVDDVKAMIDRAVEAKKDNYYWILDDGGKGEPYSYDRMMGTNPYLVLNNKWAKTVLEQDLGLANYVVYEDAKRVIYANPKDSQGPVIAYVGHGAYDGCPNNCLTDLFDFNLAPGALYSTYESFNAWGFYNKDQQPNNTNHTQLGEWIAIGGTGGVGNVYEPQATSIANEAIWMPAYATGYPLADAFYLSLPYLSWTQVVIGDPLTNIRPGKPDITLTKSADKPQVSSGDIITYAITYKNTGNGEARNIVITDPIPDGTELVEILDNGKMQGSTAKWTITSLTQDQGGTVRMRVRVE